MRSTSIAPRHRQTGGDWWWQLEGENPCQQRKLADLLANPRGCSPSYPRPLCWSAPRHWRTEDHAPNLPGFQIRRRRSPGIRHLSHIRLPSANCFGFLRPRISDLPAERPMHDRSFMFTPGRCSPGRPIARRGICFRRPTRAGKSRSTAHWATATPDRYRRSMTFTRSRHVTAG